MHKQQILYGCVIKNGELIIEPKEAEIVKQIFAAYLVGLSYQGIADKLNRYELPFSNDMPKWNKHKVKRLLENRRYIGEQEYPPIIAARIFEKVKMIIKSKTTWHNQKTLKEIIEEPAVVLPIKTVYEPATEVMQIENAINQVLEQPDDPAYVLETILKGITTRYKCVKDKEMIN